MIQHLTVEKPMTAREFLESKGLNPQLYFVSVGGEHIKNDQVIDAGVKATPIPIIKGG